MSESKIGTVEAIMLILTITVIHTILSLPHDILSSQKSASILNLIYVGAIAVALAILIIKLLKKFPGLDIIDISELIGGKIFKTLVGSIFIFYYIASSSILLRNFCENLKIVYYPMTDIMFILAIFVIAIYFGNSLDFSASLKTNLLVIPVVILSVVFLFFSNMEIFEPQKIFPILGEGVYNTFVLGLINLASFGGISFLYFLPPLLKEPEKLKKIAITSIASASIFLIFNIATLLFMFSFFLNISEISPLYAGTRYIDIGVFFQRSESIFLLIWILEFACYLSITCKFSMSIFQKLTNIESKKPINPIFCILVFSIGLLPKNYAISQFFESKIYPYMVLGIVFILGIGILILANFYKKKAKVLNRKE